LVRSPAWQADDNCTDTASHDRIYGVRAPSLAQSKRSWSTREAIAIEKDLSRVASGCALDSPNYRPLEFIAFRRKSIV
jgi:hypothetical protein